MAPLEAGVKTFPVIKDNSAVDSHQGLLSCDSHTVHAAMYLSQWAETRKDFNPEELTLAALLHGLKLPVSAIAAQGLECGECAEDPGKRIIQISASESVVPVPEIHGL